MREPFLFGWGNRYKRLCNEQHLTAIHKLALYFMWWMLWNHLQHISEPIVSQVHFKKLLMHTGKMQYRCNYWALIPSPIPPVLCLCRLWQGLEDFCIQSSSLSLFFCLYFLSGWVIYVYKPAHAHRALVGEVLSGWYIIYEYIQSW